MLGFHRSIGHTYLYCHMSVSRVSSSCSYKKGKRKPNQWDIGNNDTAHCYEVVILFHLWRSHFWIPRLHIWPILERSWCI
ncbi:hypothetical protein FKM82_011963 [Ascaphus truei]